MLDFVSTVFTVRRFPVAFAVLAAIFFGCLEAAHASQYTSSSDALAVATSDRGTFESDTRRVVELDKSIQTAKEHVSNLGTKYGLLVAGKLKYMLEIRNGEFCSGCGQTKSQILAKGEQFPHPGQHIVRPTPEQIKAKEDEYDANVASAARELANAESELKSLEQRRTDEANEMQARMAEWMDAMGAAGTLLNGEWQKEQQGIQQRVDTDKKLIGTLDTQEQMAKQASKASGDTKQGNSTSPELSASTRATIQDCERQKDSIRADLASLSKEMEEGQFRYMQARGAWTQDVADGRKSFEAAQSALGQFSGLGTWRAPDLSLPVGPATVSIGRDKLGVSVGNDVVRAGLKAEDDFLYGTQSVEAGLEVNTGVGTIQGGMSNTTTWHPTGAVTTESNPYLRSTIDDTPYQRGTTTNLLEGLTGTSTQGAP